MLKFVTIRVFLRKPRVNKMEVANFIREYLYKQDYLDVPSLGTFFLSRDPFTVDNPLQKIKPSSKNLVFRENLRITGDNLAHFMARRKQISLEEAKLSISRFTDQIQALIHSHGFIEISGFGRFSSSDGESIEFKPFPNNYSSLSFGLGELNLPPLEKKTEVFDSEKPKIFSEYKPFRISLTGDSKPSPTINEFYAPTYNDSLIAKKDSDSETIYTNDQPDKDISDPYKEPHLPISPAIEDIHSEIVENNEPNYKEILPPVEDPYSNLSPTFEKPHQNLSKPLDYSSEKEIDNASLPTAEDLYKSYSFHKTEEPQTNLSNELVSENEALIENKNESEFKESESRVKKDFDEKSSFMGLHKDEDLNDSELRKLDHPIIEDPLSHTFSPYVVSPAEETSSVKPFPWEQEIPRNREPVEKDFSVQNPTLFKNQDDGPNNTWVWILSTLLFLATLVFLGYVERVPLLKEYSKLFPGSLPSEITPASKNVTNTDSLQKASENKVPINTGDSLNKTMVNNPTEKKPNSGDSTQSNSKLNSIKTIPSSPLADVETPKATSEIALKEVEAANRFLIISSTSHLKQRSDIQSKNFSKKNLPNFIIHLKSNPLWHYMVCLGEYEDREKADQALKSLLENPIFKGPGNSKSSRPYIFENKPKKR